MAVMCSAPTARTVASAGHVKDALESVARRRNEC